jgi:hypothetical protein
METLASDFLDIDDLKDELGCGRRRAYLVARMLANTLGNKLYVTRSTLENYLHPAGGGREHGPGPASVPCPTAPSAGPSTHRKDS